MEAVKEIPECLLSALDSWSLTLSLHLVLKYSLLSNGISNGSKTLLLVLLHREELQHSEYYCDGHTCITHSRSGSHLRHFIYYLLLLLSFFPFHHTFHVYFSLSFHDHKCEVKLPESANDSNPFFSFNDSSIRLFSSSPTPLVNYSEKNTREKKKKKVWWKGKKKCVLNISWKKKQNKVAKNMKSCFLNWTSMRRGWIVHGNPVKGLRCSVCVGVTRDCYSIFRVRVLREKGKENHRSYNRSVGTNDRLNHWMRLRLRGSILWCIKRLKIATQKREVRV